MDSPFYGSYWNQPSGPGYRNQPLRRQATKSGASPKVVSIPVRFVESEATRSASASKIQKVFRGFIVRKSVKKIASIRREVEAVERTISQSDNVERIRRDARERLRVNEMLMSLLFKLDSIRGVDPGVRDYRKAVIKKAIALQERVDNIVAENQAVSGVENRDGSESEGLAGAANDSAESPGSISHDGNQASEIKDLAESRADTGNQTLEIEGKASGFEDYPDASNNNNQNSETKDLVEVQAGSASINQRPLLEVNASDCEDRSNVSSSKVSEIKETSGCDSDCPEKPLYYPDDPAPLCGECEATSENYDCSSVDLPSEACEKMDANRAGEGCGVKMEVEPCIVKDIVEDQNASLPVSESMEESLETSAREYFADRQEDYAVVAAGGREDNKRNREVLLERMMEDNEKMMSLMTQLFERNELQTRMLSSLTQRVEQLEKAFICDRLRRKKKRHAATGTTTDGLASNPDQENCGKR
ncbi:BAG family molecular chaperone regulator 6-like [Diospyros lotus]|uniref:BAG family molecular chaperone regulator 6-like n=1 Tax=Diospyros lotus TaxID=55363 RepID=UPI0022520E7A|nr:BAG family molecular chaperone regulator 6-like [Diospyros lotus]